MRLTLMQMRVLVKPNVRITAIFRAAEGIDARLRAKVIPA
jgi:predicted protein tyrosine phosphatase